MPHWLIWTLSIITVLGVVLAFWQWCYSRKLDALFPTYEQFAREGRRPVIITDRFMPFIALDYPPNLRTEALMWAEDGKFRVYGTATLERYEYAKQIWGDGPPK